jgi:hypothetical protein
MSVCLCDLISVTRSFVRFLWNSVWSFYKKLSRKRDFSENWSSESRFSLISVSEIMSILPYFFPDLNEIRPKGYVYNIVQYFFEFR